MNKTSLIIKREYLSRVKNKTFILTTLLTPLFIVALIVGTALLGSKGGDNDRKIAVIDNAGFFKNNLKSTDDIKFDFTAGIDSTNFEKQGYTDVLYIPPVNDSVKKVNFVIRSATTLGLENSSRIQNRINTAIEDKRLADNGISRTQLDSIRNNAQVAQLKTIDSSGEKNQGIAFGIGYVCGILIYITMLIYGMMVMRGVMEEKTNRIAEVIVSSVKPYQLMMGKVIGIGAVGITQFLIWGILIAIFSTVLPSFIPAADAVTGEASKIGELTSSLATVNWPVVIGAFIFYFIGGYLFYAALFAAIGSVIDDINNANSLTMPITMPIIFSFVIMTVAIRNTSGPLAVWASIIPFTSPVVMMGLIGFGVPETVPYWQLFASMAALILGFLFTIWLAAKIYRTGILMYGKKPSWKQMFTWAFRKS